MIRTCQILDIPQEIPRQGHRPGSLPVHPKAELGQNDWKNWPGGRVHTGVQCTGKDITITVFQEQAKN